MYLLAHDAGDARVFETARETLCHLYDLPSAAVGGARVTDCDGRPLTEAQLTTLSIAEGLMELRDPNDS